MHTTYYSNKESNKERSPLVDKRLTESWFYFHLLLLHKEYFGTLSEFKAPLVQDLDESIIFNRNLFMENFHKQASSQMCSSKMFNCYKH